MALPKLVQPDFRQPNLAYLAYLAYLKIFIKTDTRKFGTINVNATKFPSSGNGTSKFGKKHDLNKAETTKFRSTKSIKSTFSTKSVHSFEFHTIK